MMINQEILVFITAICLTVDVLPQRTENLRAVTDCVCSNDNVTYECIVCGGFATVWEGSAFNREIQCREITLEHRHFGTPEAFGVCNGGRIVARGVSVDNGCYMSYLNITFDAALQDCTVICTADNGSHTREIGHDVLHASTVSFPQPERLRLARVNPSEMVFSWDQTQFDCPSLYYNIFQTNCGTCPVSTNNTTLECFGFSKSDSITLCNFRVQAVICRNSAAPIIGNLIITIVNLTVPKTGQVLSIPHYNNVHGGLQRLTVNFSTLSPLNIYEGINGSVTSYTVTYLDSISGGVYGSDTILASRCVGGSCNTSFEILSLKCVPSSGVNVTVFATSIIGDGPTSNPVKEEYRNSLVDVELVPELTSIICTFKNTEVRITDSCNATVIYGTNCESQRQIIGTNENGHNIASIKLGSFLDETMPSKYCNFTVSARVGTKLLFVEGNLDVFSIGNVSGIAIVLPVVSTLIVAKLVTSSMAFAAALFYKRHKKNRQLYGSAV